MPFEFNMIFQSLDWFLKRKRAACSNWAATVLAQRRSGPSVLLEAKLGLVQPAGPRARRQRGGHEPVLGWCFYPVSKPSSWAFAWAAIAAVTAQQQEWGSQHWASCLWRGLHRPGQIGGGWRRRASRPVSLRMQAPWSPCEGACGAVTPLS